MSTLHILNKFPDHPRFRACLEAIAEGDTLLLIENGVLATLTAAGELPATTHTLAADLAASGIRPAEGDTRVVDYPGMVRLTTTHSHIISW